MAGIMDITESIVKMLFVSNNMTSKDSSEFACLNRECRGVANYAIQEFVKLRLSESNCNRFHNIPQELKKTKALYTEAVMQLLQKEKIDLNTKDQFGYTPLNRAILYKNTKGAELLIESKADLNATNEYGETPLHLAIAKRNIKVARLLFQEKVKNLCSTTLRLISKLTLR